MKKLYPYILGVLILVMSPITYRLKDMYLNYLGFYDCEVGTTCMPGYYEMYSFLYFVVRMCLIGYSLYLLSGFNDND